MRARVVWVEISLLLVALTFVELGEVLRELRTDIVLDWFISLAPLIWINASAAVMYAFVRLYFSSGFAPPTTEAARTRAVSFLVPNLRMLRARPNRMRRVWAIASVAYAVAFGYLQGIFVVDFSGSLQPVSVVIESAIGYGPGIAWAPTTTFGVQLRPYSVAAAITLSLLSGLVFAFAFQVVTRTKRATKAFPGPLLGFAVMCPACASGPLSGLFLAYVAPIAFMGGMGSASAFSRLLGVSTVLLLVTLILLWTLISFLSNALPSGATSNALEAHGSNSD